MLDTFGTFDKHKLSSWDAPWKYIAFLFLVISQNWFDAPFYLADIFPPQHLFVNYTMKCLNQRL